MPQRDLAILALTETSCNPGGYRNIDRLLHVALRNGCAQYESGIQSFRIPNHQRDRTVIKIMASGAVRT